MTENEWSVSTNPGPMLDAIGTSANDRKLRLFASACVRRLSAFMKQAEICDEVLVCERFADGQAGIDELVGHERGARGGYSAVWAAENAQSSLRQIAAMTAARGASTFMAHYASLFEMEKDDRGAEEFDRESALAARQAELSEQAAIAREVFGNPFGSVSFRSGWRSVDVIGVARAIYEDRAFDRLPILADALMDAGCDDEQILAHCRSEGPHARGCWVVDLVLGKE